MHLATITEDLVDFRTRFSNRKTRGSCLHHRKLRGRLGRSSSSRPVGDYLIMHISPKLEKLERIAFVSHFGSSTMICEFV